MKKYYLSILTVATCLALPMTTLAATSIIAATSLGGTVAFAPSKSVTVGISATDAAYSAVALHAQGTEAYGMLSSDTTTYFSTVAAASTLNNPTVATALATIPTGGTAWAPK